MRIAKKSKGCTFQRGGSIFWTRLRRMQQAGGHDSLLAKVSFSPSHDETNTEKDALKKNKKKKTPASENNGEGGGALAVEVADDSEKKKARKGKGILCVASGKEGGGGSESKVLKKRNMVELFLEMWLIVFQYIPGRR